MSTSSPRDDDTPARPAAPGGVQLASPGSSDDETQLTERPGRVPTQPGERQHLPRAPNVLEHSLVDATLAPRRSALSGAGSAAPSSPPTSSPAPPPAPSRSSSPAPSATTSAPVATELTVRTPVALASQREVPNNDLAAQHAGETSPSSSSLDMLAASANAAGVLHTESTPGERAQFTRELRGLILAACRSASQEDDGEQDASDQREQLQDAIRQCRAALEHCFAAGVSLPFTSEGLALAQSYFRVAGLLGVGEPVPASVTLRDLMLYTPERVTMSRAAELVSQLLTELSDASQPGDEVFAAVALFRQVRERFGIRNFLVRAERTAQLASWLVTLFPFLLQLAGLRAPVSRAPASADAGDAGPQVDGPATEDLLPLSFVGLRAVADINVQLRREIKAATKAASQSKARQARAEQELARARDELVPAQRQVNELEAERDQLRQQLHALREERDQLKSAAQGEDQRVQHAVDEAIARERATASRFTDREMQTLYENTWRIGRVMGQPNEWYQFLRSAVTGKPSGAPPDLIVTIMTVPNDPRPASDPPQMQGLASFRPLTGSSSATPARAITPRAASPGPAPPAAPAAIDLTGEASSSTGRVREQDGLFSPGNSKRRRLFRQSFDTSSDDDSAFESPGGSRRLPGRNAKANAAGLTHARALQSSFDQGRAGGGAVSVTSARAAAAHEASARDDGAGDSPKAGPANKPDPDPIVIARASDEPRGWYIQTTLRQSVYTKCCTPIRAEPGSAGNTWTSSQIAIPFELGSVRGRSSTVPYKQMGTRQLEEVFGLSVQAYPSQTTFYPNYYISRNRYAIHMARLAEPDGPDEYEALLEARPWNAMWRRRVTQFFFVVPRELSASQANWLVEQLKFQFRWREAYWVLGHWLSVSRNLPPGSRWAPIHSARSALVVRFRKAFAAHRALMPDGLTPLIWSEPAIWYPPDHECNWAVRDLSEQSLEDQLHELDQLEPIRSQWSSAPGRFVEALLPEQLDLLNEELCWEMHVNNTRSVNNFGGIAYPPGETDRSKYTAIPVSASG